MSREFILLAVVVLGLTGCSTKEAARQTSAPRVESKEASVIRELNQQIELFNSTRPPHMGIVPIDQRVSRIEDDLTGDQIRCLDQNGDEFLVLQRQEDGSFKGAIEVEYHELSDPTRHSWGHVFAEFYLKQETF